MSVELDLRCSCGRVHGTLRGVSPSTVNRLVCHCGGCQRYARALGRAGEILDVRGGSDLFQVCPASLTIHSGSNNISCLQQTPKGALRWYTNCCGSPFVNTMASESVPFMGILRSAVGLGRGQELQADKVLGPVRAHVHANQQLALRERSQAVLGTAFMVLRFSALLLRWRLRGDHRRWALDWRTTIDSDLRLPQEQAPINANSRRTPHDHS